MMTAEYQAFMLSWGKSWQEFSEWRARVIKKRGVGM